MFLCGGLRDHDGPSCGRTPGLGKKIERGKEKEVRTSAGGRDADIVIVSAAREMTASCGWRSRRRSRRGRCGFRGGWGR